jgi:hypothetical protein
MITLSIYKKLIKQCGDIRNLHKAVKTLWQSVELRRVNNEQTKSTASKRKNQIPKKMVLLN